MDMAQDIANVQAHLRQTVGREDLSGIKDSFRRICDAALAAAAEAKASARREKE